VKFLHYVQKKEQSFPQKKEKKKKKVCGLKDVFMNQI